ncbi:protein stum homolog [Uloborus diversus]|uniref:protein stum homolog n=1 Tax=Uloborus diversus TaxID=327109 RepID=UPI0024096C89|nr:protein stum homolog [Uloborus diversus]
MTASTAREYGAGPCRVNTLPPLYPHCMRHQQHRCLYGNPQAPLGRCLPQAASDGHLDGLLQRRASERSRRPLPSDGLLVLKVVSSACAEPDKKAHYEIVSVNERHGRFRKAVPCMPLALSILLCIVNMLAPGFGTFLAALTVLCGCPTEYDDKCTAFLYNVLASLLQLFTALIVVGWVWSIMWGITFVSISITKKEHDIVAASL